jgi:hypothetical protein
MDDFDKSGQPPYYSPPHPTVGTRYNDVCDIKVDTSFFYIARDAPLKLREHVDCKNVWNGQRETFDGMYVGLQSRALLAGIGYMFNPQFNQVYSMGGWGHALMPSQPRVSTAQFAQEKEALYGAIRSAFHLTKTDKRYTTK